METVGNKVVFDNTQEQLVIKRGKLLSLMVENARSLKKLLNELKELKYELKRVQKP